MTPAKIAEQAKRMAPVSEVIDLASVWVSRAKIRIAQGHGARDWLARWRVYTAVQNAVQD
jgi:hypothetical protein